MATALLHRTEPDAARHHAETRRTAVVGGQMQAELAGIPLARRRLLALAAAVEHGTAPAAALVERTAAPATDRARITHVLRRLADIRQLERQLDVLRLQMSRQEHAADRVACRRDMNDLVHAIAAILRDLPISPAFVRSLVAQLLTLEAHIRRASQNLAGPGDIDQIHVLERHIGLRAERFSERCAQIRRVAARLTERRAEARSPSKPTGHDASHACVTRPAASA